MKVLFLEDNHIENVSDGYARNYLLPRKLVVLATKAVEAAAEKRKDKKKAEVENKKIEMQAVAEKLASMEFEIKMDVGEGGKLFGSVTSGDVAKIVKKTAEVELDRKKIDLTTPIKAAGEYTVPVKLYQDVKTGIKLKVSPK